MNKLFEEKSIKDEKKKLKRILSILKNINKKTDFSKYNKINIERKKIESELYNSGIKRILFDKDWYYLNKPDIQDEKRKKTLRDLNIDPSGPTDIVKYSGDIAKRVEDDVLIPDKITDKDGNIIGEEETDLVKYDGKDGKIIKFRDRDELPPVDQITGDDRHKFKFLPDKEYNVYDIVYIVTPSAKFKSIYMGMEGTDVQNILDKLNPQFEKADPFDGVFVLFTESLSKSFIQKGVRIFLLNEYKIGKGKQIIKAYTNDGKFITKYKVSIDKIELLKKQEMPHRIAASLRIPVGPSLLEKINSTEFQDFINRTDEVLTFNDFNTDIDFEEIKEL